MRSDPWNPDQYEEYKDERSRPFFDLLALVEKRPGMRVLDLGCGTGELTRQMHELLAAAETVGLDSSDAMLEKSKAFVTAGLRFEKGEIATFQPTATYDLVFSNAALQWVEDHPTIFANLCRALAPGGQLAVQVPANFDQPTHVVAGQLAGEEPFRTELDGYVRMNAVPSPEEYACLLHDLGFVEQRVMLNVYPHYLESREKVVEWVKGTLLTAYERRMSAESYARFLERYRQRLLPQLSDTEPFFFPFKRILLHAVLPACE